MTRLLTLAEIAARCRMEPESDCWIWVQGCTGTGSPNVWHDGLTQPAARVAWSLVHGAIERSMRMIRTCCEPKCINPEHGRLLTGAQFIRYQIGTHAGRSSVIRSLAVRNGRTRAGYTKLHDKLEAIRARIRSGDSNAAIARDYGVHHSSISNIRRGRCWPEVSPWAI